MSWTFARISSSFFPTWGQTVLHLFHCFASIFSKLVFQFPISDKKCLFLFFKFYHISTSSCLFLLSQGFNILISDKEYFLSFDHISTSSCLFLLSQRFNIPISDKKYFLVYIIFPPPPVFSSSPAVASRSSAAADSRSQKAALPGND